MLKTGVARLYPELQSPNFKLRTVMTRFSTVNDPWLETTGRARRSLVHLVQCARRDGWEQSKVLSEKGWED